MWPIASPLHMAAACWSRISSRALLWVLGMESDLCTPLVVLWLLVWRLFPCRQTVTAAVHHLLQPGLSLAHPSLRITS